MNGSHRQSGRRHNYFHTANYIGRVNPVLLPPCAGARGLTSFFFRGEDGIRGGTVTGVQTCALPISGGGPDVALFRPFWTREFAPLPGGLPLTAYTGEWGGLFGILFNPWTIWAMLVEAVIFGSLFEIGRASCRDRA